MTEALGGLEMLVPTTLELAKPLIQPGEDIIGCIRATHQSSQQDAFVLLSTRLLYICPYGVYPSGKKTLSIEYVDVRTVEIEEIAPNLLVGAGVLHLIIETDYRYEARQVQISIKPVHKQYTANFAETLRAKVREARMPLQKPKKDPSSFIDELERLNSLHNQGGLTDEEFAAAKRKLLS